MPPDFKPYLLRALYEWCADRGQSPYLAVSVDGSCRVPLAHVRNGQIVFDISMDATGQLEMDNEAVSFQARFGGVAHSIYVPIDRVLGLFPEGDQSAGTFFEVPQADAKEKHAQNSEQTDKIPLEDGSAVAKPRFSRVK